MTGIGYAGGNSLQVILKDISRIEHLAVVAILAVTTVLLLVRWFRGRRKTLR
jgi:membrane protein DedA with SNARE-associated domain